MSTPLASKTTFSSRMKMSATTHAKSNGQNMNHNNNHVSNNIWPNGAASKLAPRTAVKPSSTSANNRMTTEKKQNFSTNSSRIAPPRSSLPKRVPNAPIQSDTRNGAFVAPTVTTIQRSTDPAFSYSRSSSKLSVLSSTATPRISQAIGVTGQSARTGSTLTSRENSLASTSSINASTVRKSTISSSKSTHIPDTNSIRRGLAKFSNPIECQRQFQALNSEIKRLNEVNENKSTRISHLQKDLDGALKTGVCYAIVVQYFAKKLRFDTDELDLESECHQLRGKVKELLKGESEYESKLAGIIQEFTDKIRLEQDLKQNIERVLEETKEAHSSELANIEETHKHEFSDLVERHTSLRLELESKISHIQEELDSRTRELAELRKDYETLNDNYNKLEESLTKDKDARVKYAQEKANQLQKEVDSLNSVLEMRTERMHILEKDSILLSEAQHDLATVRDINKALKQQLESLNAALDIKREKFENLVAEKERISQDLKRERKERRRMTMRTEQLEYALNESFSNENNITILDPESVET